MKTANQPLRHKPQHLERSVMGQTQVASVPSNSHVTQTAEVLMKTQRYAQMRAILINKIPLLANALPLEWPTQGPVIDQRKTLAVLRSVASTLNEGLLIVGFGDGSLIERLRQDPIGRGKLIHLFVLADEVLAFAHVLGEYDFSVIFKTMQLEIHYVTNTGDLNRVMTSIYANHGQIARLAGTELMVTHPLLPAAEKIRAEWVPLIKKIIIERYDCLGNDVYDTFLGAKHALMHGEKLVRQCRSSDYRNRYAGKSALCIASGPSVGDYYEKIRAIQHEHIIICADSIFDGLIEHGIDPDFVCMVERPADMHNLIDKYGATSKAVMVALPVVHPSSVEPFADRVMWWWNSDDLYPWLDPKEFKLHSGRSAGTITVALAGLLGVKEAYLIGHDLSFRDGQSHAVGVNAMAPDTFNAVKHQSSRDSANYHLRLIDAERNGGGTLETQGLWEIFRSDIVLIMHPYREQTKFINLNIATKTGLVIAGTVEGTLPEPSGKLLEKSHPTRVVADDAWPKFRERCLQLGEDFRVVKEKLDEVSKELESWRPLAQDRKTVEAMGSRVDITKIAHKDNSSWFGYVFRAALRNLMVRLHHNTYVGTMAERNWNQVQIMRLYSQTIPMLIERLRPELEQALEKCK
jgi:hypothetical protein